MALFRCTYVFICVYLKVGEAHVCLFVCVFVGACVCKLSCCTCVNVRRDTGVGGKEGGVACSNGSLKEINGLQMAQSIYSNETCKVAGQPSEIRLGLAERSTAKETRAVSLSPYLMHKHRRTPHLPFALS